MLVVEFMKEIQSSPSGSVKFFQLLGRVCDLQNVVWEPDVQLEILRVTTAHTISTASVDDVAELVLNQLEWVDPSALMVGEDHDHNAGDDDFDMTIFTSTSPRIPLQPSLRCVSVCLPQHQVGIRLALRSRLRDSSCPNSRIRKRPRQSFFSFAGRWSTSSSLL